jgi:hypothetical protein
MGVIMPEISNHQDLVDSFLHQFMPPRAAPAAKAVSTEAAPDEVVQKLLVKAQDELLWDGYWDYEDKIFGRPYTSQSEADFSLLGAIVRHADGMGVPVDIVADASIRVFEQSGLYRSEKHYRVLTQDIPNLIASHYVTAFQTLPDGAGVGKKTRLISGQINLTNILPPPRDFVWEGFILAGKVCVLAGFGGVSKTMFLMMLAVHIALGKNFLDKQVKVGCALLILGEEDQEEIDRRINAICHALDLDADKMTTVGNRIRAYPMIGQDARFAKIEVGSVEGTDFPDEVIDAAKKLEAAAEVPLALVGLDHAGVIHGGNFNAREDVVQTMNQIGKVAKETGASTMLLAHSPKGAMNEEEPDQNNVTGSAAFVDLARAAFVLKTMTGSEGKPFGIGQANRSKYVSFSVVKNNYGPTGEKIWLERFPVAGYSVSILGLANLTKPQPVNASRNLGAQVKTFIAQYPGQYTKTSLRDTQGGKPGPFKVGKNLVAASVEDLLATGDLQLVPPTGDQREKFGLRAQVTQVLEAV